jgi:hypothetical protein
MAMKWIAYAPEGTGYDKLGFPVDGQVKFFDRDVPYEVDKDVADAMVRENCGFKLVAAPKTKTVEVDA